MFGAIARKFFGTANERTIKELQARVAAINALEPQFQAYSDEELRRRTEDFRNRLMTGTSTDDLLNEAFATVREAAVRTLGQRHYDVQLIGGMVLHEGKIAEMKTGEGKTLVSTLAVYLNALAAEGVHVVTVNDYLAKRDAEWMGQIYRFLGLSVGCITNDLDEATRREAYECDITYGTNNEFGFDYLRDNMKFSAEGMVQRGHHFAIVDEVDSILVDEARTPLIISGPAEDSSALYQAVNGFVPTLVAEDYELDEKQRTATFSESGQEKLQHWLAEQGLLKSEELYDASNITLVHHANQALRAHLLFTRDKDYLVKDGKVIIVDEFTGRMMAGRRYSDGLHQALEAKEAVPIQRENQTLASITFQNYFRLYDKLAGMTGTAATEAEEFETIYGLSVVEIPTHRDMVRADEDDEVYRSQAEKDQALLDEIRSAHDKGQPVLVGTASIERSEHVANLLQKAKIKHEVLNARQHAREAQIIAQAGRLGALTIATNMAGRGTDIQLGGNVEMRALAELEGKEGEAYDKGLAAIKAEVEAERARVKAAGGLYVIGTERHESRRIDNQLRGRSGRQGDAGRSKFYLSLDDDLMRIFGSQRMDGLLQRLGMKEGEAIIHPWINKALEKAQQKVEARNFDIRKNLLKFDDVMNDQRKEIYGLRRELIEADEVSETVTDMRHQVIDNLVASCIPENVYPEQWDIERLSEQARKILGVEAPVAEWAQEEGVAEGEIHERLRALSDQHMAEKEERFGAELMRTAEKQLLLQILDHLWKEHLLQLEYLRGGIHLRGYGQKDPLNEYKREAFAMFEALLGRLRESVTGVLAHLQIQQQPTAPAASVAPTSARAPAKAAGAGAELFDNAPAPAAGNGDVLVAERPRADSALDEVQPQPAEAEEDWGKVPRNAPCPCGSGKKYKHCHGRV